MGKVRDTDALAEFAIFVGDPAVLNVTLCVSDAKSHVAVPPAAMLTLGGVN